MKALYEYLSTKIKPSKIVINDYFELFSLVRKEIKLFGPDIDLNYIDVSKLDTLYIGYNSTRTYSGLFEDTDFCGDISKWNVSNCTNFALMFKDCKNFNCDLSEWNMERAENISSMFCCCYNFNQSLNNWNLPNLKRAYMTFRYCEKLNQSFSNWKPYIEDCKLCERMFSDCISLNQNFSSWDLTKTNSLNMFDNCPKMSKYNLPIM